MRARYDSATPETSDVYRDIDDDSERRAEYVPHKRLGHSTARVSTAELLMAMSRDGSECREAHCVHTECAVHIICTMNDSRVLVDNLFVSTVFGAVPCGVWTAAST